MEKESSKATHSKVKTTAARENELLKYEFAEELGLLEKINNSGWKSLTARESGKIGGMISKRKKERG